MESSSFSSKPQVNWCHYQVNFEYLVIIRRTDIWHSSSDVERCYLCITAMRESLWFLVSGRFFSFHIVVVQLFFPVFLALCLEVGGDL
mmetsp:Transcript_2358/g.3016  ORF Transcript_2358/g.3016 Transcript_2358/m.3016 type:complete len:88 (+) Transcript_2358:179-442(+)